MSRATSAAAIPLVNSSRVALVDEADLTMASPHRWYISSNGYVKRIVRWSGEQKTHSVYLHRQLLGVGRGVYVDHVNHDLLDNRRANLRECNGSQQLGNQHPRQGTSRYKGVHRRGGHWLASIHFGGKTYRLGKFHSEAEAGRAYDVAAVVYFGRFALLNFPLPPVLEAMRAKVQGAA